MDNHIKACLQIDTDFPLASSQGGAFLQAN